MSSNTETSTASSSSTNTPPKVLKCIQFRSEVDLLAQLREHSARCDCESKENHNRILLEFPDCRYLYAISMPSISSGMSIVVGDDFRITDNTPRGVRTSSVHEQAAIRVLECFFVEQSILQCISSIIEYTTGLQTSSRFYNYLYKEVETGLIPLMFQREYPILFDYQLEALSSDEQTAYKQNQETRRKFRFKWCPQTEIDSWDHQRKKRYEKRKTVHYQEALRIFQRLPTQEQYELITPFVRHILANPTLFKSSISYTNLQGAVYGGPKETKSNTSSPTPSMFSSSLLSCATLSTSNKQTISQEETMRLVAQKIDELSVVESRTSLNKEQGKFLQQIEQVYKYLEENPEVRRFARGSKLFNNQDTKDNLFEK